MPHLNFFGWSYDGQVSGMYVVFGGELGTWLTWIAWYGPKPNSVNLKPASRVVVEFAQCNSHLTGKID
jgi:hypothetical protein